MKLILSLLLIFSFCDFAYAVKMTTEGKSKMQKNNKMPPMLELALVRLKSAKFDAEAIQPTDIKIQDFTTTRWTLKPKQKTTLEVYVYLVDYFDGIKLVKTFDPK